MAQNGVLAYPSVGLGNLVENAVAHRGMVGEQLSDRHNALNFLRLVFALMVVLSHAFVGGFSDPFLLGGMSLGAVGVYGFFGISGYLIAASASHNALGRFLWLRFLRIFPAYWVCLFLTGFGFAAVVWLQKAHHCGFSSCYLGSPTGPVQYVLHNFFLRIDQPRIAGTPPLTGGGWPFQWDVPLWTLFYEFLCYLILAVLAATGLLRHRRLVAALAVSLWALEIAVGGLNLNPNFDDQSMLIFMPIFLTGSLVYLYRDKIPDDGRLALLLGAVFLVSPWIPFGGTNSFFDLAINADQILAPLFVYPVLWLGIHLRPLQRIGAHNDYSYGIYIYAFLVQQMLAIWHVQRWGYVAYMTLSVVATLPFAVGSWWLIEKQALTLRRIQLDELRHRLGLHLPPEV
jgi:peptidoglycan/LPS O-acetylase OafA/YrhL